MTPVSVFFSSTYLDLRQRRRDLIESVLRLRWVYPRSMEIQPAASAELLHFCLRMVGECPIYIGLVDSRYGKRYVANGESLSLTHHEFRQATRLEHYRIICASSKTDAALVDDAAGLESLRAEMQTRYLVWFNPRRPVELVREIMAALDYARSEVNERAWLFIRKSRASMESLEEQLRVRRHLAASAGEVDASRIWLQPYYHVRPDVTVCHCCLPGESLHRLVDTGAWQAEDIVAFYRDDGQLPTL